MQTGVLNQVSSLAITCFLFVFIFIFYGVGHFFKQRRNKNHPDLKDDGLGPIEGALLGLLALLLSFTFSVSSTRFDNRIQVMMQEANAIRNAITNTDIFPDSQRRELHQLLSGYLEARIALYDARTDKTKNEEAIAQTNRISKKIQNTLRGYIQSNSPGARSASLSYYATLNELNDLALARKVSRETTIPDSVMWLLLLLCITSSFIIGYGSRKKIDWILVSGFATMLSITIFAIIDLDRPHRGLNKLDQAEQHFLELKEVLNKQSN